MATDAEKIAARLEENQPAVPTDLDNRLQKLKSDLEVRGLATLYLQRGARGQVVGFTILDSNTIEEVPVPGKDSFYLQHIPGAQPARLEAGEVMRIDTRPKAADAEQESKSTKGSKLQK